MRISNAFKRVAGATWAAGALILAVLAVTAPALAAAPSPGAPAALPTPTPVATPIYEDDRKVLQGDQVVSGGDFTLHSDEVLRGDLTSFGANVVLEENSRVEGNVTLFGGQADISGTITRDLTSLGGATHLRPSAHIVGSQTGLGGSVTRDSGSVVEGEHTQEPGSSVNNQFPSEWLAPFRYFMDRVGNVLSTVGGIILLTLLSVAIVALFPAYVARIAEVAREQWVVSGGAGLLTFIVVPVAIVILAITICLIPAALLLTVIWALTMLGGWAVIASILGERLVIGLKVTGWTVAAKTALGAAVLAVLGLLPLIGWLIGWLAVAWGMGALILMFANVRTRPL